MATCRDLITDALRELNVLAAGEVATADEADHGLLTFNRLVDQWQAERLNIYSNTRTTFTIVSGTQEYSVGATGDADVPRPVFPEHVNYQDTAVTPTLEYQLQPLTDDAWSRVPMKTLTSPRPTCYYWNPTFPLVTLSLWPVPTSTTLQGVIYAPEQVTEFTDLTTLVSLPPGYRRFIVKNLALELAPSYEKPVHPALMEQAMDSKAVVKRANKDLMDMNIEQAALGAGRGGKYTYSILMGP